MFFTLPNEIIGNIYEYDNTYREIFQKVLEEIEIFEIFVSKAKIYYIYDKEEKTLYTTDSVQNPGWICSSFKIFQDRWRNLIKVKNLTRSSEKLEYDIQNYCFFNTYFDFNL